MKQFVLVVLLLSSLVSLPAQVTYRPLKIFHVEEPGTLHEVMDSFMEELTEDFINYYVKSGLYLTDYYNIFAQNWKKYQSLYNNIKITGCINCHDIHFLSSLDYSEVVIKLWGKDYSYTVDVFAKLDLSDASFVGSEKPMNVYDRNRNFSDVYSRENDKMGPYVFDENELEKLILPKNLKAIHEYAFDESYGIDTIVIGEFLESFPHMNDSITGFEGIARKYWNPLAQSHLMELSTRGEDSYIEVSDKNPHFTTINGSLYDKDVTTLIRCYPDGIIAHGFPETMTRFGDGVRVYTTNHPIELPKTLTSIGHFGVSQITGLNFEGRELGGVDFVHSLFFPEKLETIGDYGMRLSRNTHIILGENIKELGYRAFYNWSSYLHGVGSEILYCLSPIPPKVGTEAFYGEIIGRWEITPYKHKCVVVPMGSKAAYEQVPGIANYFEEIIEVDDVMACYYELLPVGVEDLTADLCTHKEIGRYTLQGVRLEHPVKGINIIKYSDGTSKKVWVK